MIFTCDRCGIETGREYSIPWLHIEVKDAYKTRSVNFVCENCAKKANDFVDYYGKKKPEDIEALKQFLNSGLVSRNNETKALSCLMNAGYY